MDENWYDDFYPLIYGNSGVVHDWAYHIHWKNVSLTMNSWSPIFLFDSVNYPVVRR